MELGQLAFVVVALAAMALVRRRLALSAPARGTSWGVAGIAGLLLVQLLAR